MSAGRPGPQGVHPLGGRGAKARLGRGLQNLAESCQPGTGIGDHSGVDREVEREPAGGVFDLKHGRLGREGRIRVEPDLLEEGAADEKDDVRVTERVPDTRVVERHSRPEAGMALGEVHALHQALGIDPGAEELGEPHELVLGGRACHPVADHDRGTFGPQQSSRQSLDGGGFGLRRAVEVAEGPGFLQRLLLEDVDRQGDEHRAGRRIVRDLEGSVQHWRELVRVFDLNAPLDQRRGHRHEVVAEQGFAQPGACVLLAGRDHHRGVGLPCVVEHAEAVAEAGRHVQVDDSGDAGGLGVVVGGAQGDGLVQGEHVAQVRMVAEPVHQGALGRARVAEQEGDAVLGKGIEQDVAAALGCVSGTDRWHAHGGGG